MASACRRSNTLRRPIFGYRLRMDVALENPVSAGTEGARRILSLNLSGKRTEWAITKVTFLAPIFSPEHLASGAFLSQIKQKEVMKNGSDFDQCCCCGKRHSVE